MWWLRTGRDTLEAEVTPGEERDPSPTLSSLDRSTGAGEEPPQQLVVKNSGDSNHPGETEGCSKSRHPGKGPVHRLSHVQALTLSCSRRTETQGVLETYGGRLRCVASERGQLSYSLRQVLLSCNRQTGAIFPMLSPPPHGQL